MRKYFPPEIIKLSTEDHFSKYSTKSRIIYFSVLLFLIAIIGSLFLIQIEITVQSRGIIRSSGEPVQIVSPIVAEVIKSVLQENVSVAIGDTLIWLNNDKLEEKISYLQKLNAEKKVYLNDLVQMLDYKYTHIKSDLYRTALAQYNQKLIELDLNIGLLQKSFGRARTLYEKEVIPLTELEEKEFQLNSKKEEKENLVKYTNNEWHRLITEYRQAIDRNKNEIEGLLKERENYFILAPASGTIKNYNGILSGSYVSTGQNIAAISLNNNLITELLVSPKDIGYLKEGMSVMFQVDAFNYNQWGLASGKIKVISNEVYIFDNQPFFKVRCSLIETHLSLKNGTKGELLKGLTITGRFQITKRTLAQLLFDKADDWLNPKVFSN